MAIHKTAGAKFYISPTEADSDAINAMTDQNAIAYFAGLSDWIEVEEVEDMGGLGDTSEPITFVSVGDRRVRKLKGSKDAGTHEIVVGRDPLDAGQVQMIAAEGTDFNYPFKVEYADARSSNHTDSVQYYAGLVMAAPTNLGPVNNVTRRNFSVGINTPVFEVESAVIST